MSIKSAIQASYEKFRLSRRKEQQEKRVKFLLKDHRIMKKLKRQLGEIENRLNSEGHADKSELDDVISKYKKVQIELLLLAPYAVFGQDQLLELNEKISILVSEIENDISDGSKFYLKEDRIIKVFSGNLADGGVSKKMLGT